MWARLKTATLHQHGKCHIRNRFALPSNEEMPRTLERLGLLDDSLDLCRQRYPMLFATLHAFRRDDPGIAEHLIDMEVPNFCRPRRSQDKESESKIRRRILTQSCVEVWDHHPGHRRRVADLVPLPAKQCLSLGGCLDIKIQAHRCGVLNNQTEAIDRLAGNR